MKFYRIIVYTRRRKRKYEKKTIDRQHWRKRTRFGPKKMDRNQQHTYKRIFHFDSAIVFHFILRINGKNSEKTIYSLNSNGLWPTPEYTLHSTPSKKPVEMGEDANARINRINTSLSSYFYFLVGINSSQSMINNIEKHKKQYENEFTTPVLLCE